MQKRKASLIVCALLSLTLIGCSSSPKVIHIKAEPIDPVPLILPDVDRIELESTKFYVVNETNAQEIFAELRKKNYDPVIFGVTDDGYEILSVNNAKVLQLVRQQKAIIIAYKEYYEKANKAINENNESLAEQEKAADEARVVEEGSGGIIPDGSLFKRLLPW
jgi:hypothetical protein